MRRLLLGFTFGMVWLALYAGTAPGPAPTGRTATGIPAPVIQPHWGPAPETALPVPQDSLPPEAIDTAYTVGRQRLLRWQLGLGITGLAIGFQLVTLLHPASTAVFILVLLGALLCFTIAMLLPGIVGRQRVLQMGRNWMARRGINNLSRVLEPSPDTMPRQGSPSPKKVNKWLWWFLGTAIAFTLMMVWPTGALLLFADLVFSIGIEWLVWLSLFVGFLGLCITTSVAFSWTRRLRRHAPNKPLQVVQILLFISVFLAMILAVLLLALTDFIFLFYFYPYMLLLIPFLLFVCGIITFIRGYQIRKALRQQ